MISVLYVDDEPELLEIGKLFLEQTHEFSVDTVVSAPEALVRLQEKKFDAVLSDYQMPEMDGIRFLQTLRGRGDTIPFIIFTGRGREEVIIEALNSGVDFYLQKGGDPTSQFAELRNIIIKSVQQKRAEKAQRQSEKRVYDILSHLPEATFAIDRAGRVIAWNMAIERMTGVRAADILEKNDREYAIPFYGIRRPLLIDLIDEPDTVLNDWNYRNIQRDGPALIAETSDAHPHGTAMVIWAKVTPVYDEKGNRAGAIETLRDITEQRKTLDDLRAAYEQITAAEEEMRAQYEELKFGQNALRESERKLQGIVQGSPIPQFVIDNNHRVISWNSALERYSGVKAGEVLGTNQQWRAFYSEMRPCMADLLVDGTIDRIPEWYPGKFSKSKYVEGAFEATDFFPRMGTRGIWLYFTASALRDSKGTIIGAVETLEDITEIKVKEEALRASEEQYRNVVETQTEFICRFRPDGTHVFVNEAYCRYFGKKCPDLIGEKFRPDIPPEDQAGIRGHFASLTRDHPVSAIDHRIIMPDGSLRWQRWVDRAIFDGSGTLIEYQTVGRDITDIKEAEFALRESEEQYSALFHKNHSVSILIDPDTGIIVDANAAACTYYGYRYEQITKMGIFEINRLNKKKVLHDLARAKNQKEKHFNSIHYLASGEQRFVEVYSGPIKGKGKLLLYSVIHDITDRRQAEQALRDSENKLSAIVRGSPIPQFVIDKNHTVIQWNKALESYSGIPAKDVIGTNQQWRAFYPEERPCMADLLVEGRIEKIPRWYTGKYRKSLLIEDAYEATDFFPHMGKTGTWLHFTAAPIRDAQGVVIGAVETLDDITDRKNAENNLRESEEKYRTILNNIQDTFYRSDRDGNLVMMSPSGARLLGFDSTDELMGWNIAEKLYADPADRTRFLEAMKKTGSVEDYPVDLKRKDGSVVTVSTNSHFYSDASGNLLGVEGIFRDITEHRHAEESLKASENLYRTIFENTGAASIIIAPDTTILLANTRWEKLTGIKKEEQENKKSWTEFIDKDDVERMRQYHYARRKDPALAPRIYECRLIDASTNIHYCVVNVDVISGSSNSVASMVDITDFKQAEKRLARKIEELGRSNAELEQFAYIASHDLQEPLRMIASYLQLIERRYKGQLDDNADEFINYAVDGAKRLQNMINGLLDFSRVQTKGMPFASVDLEKILKDTLNNEKIAIRESQAVITHDPLPGVWADAGQIMRVFQNLIDNAIKFRGSEPVKIHISARQGGDFWIFSVSDNGIGFDPEYGGKLFTLFRRLHGVDYPGTGIGLAVCKRIVERHGGKIWVESVPHKGSTFHFSIPVRGEGSDERQ
ncbi:PAS domain S-box protein [uncultured Methanoregula sp.]|uniref:PAS domain S-box protein n=1 Tax=uncultured Methanoregula sp. TaxID=1005933 RepID=UPI002AAA9681|nr:PAS domain S-box protein [uncultured Methanoregula sp.]